MEFKDKRQRFTVEKVELKKKLQADIISMKDSAYTLFEEGFDKEIA